MNSLQSGYRLDFTLCTAILFLLCYHCTAADAITLRHGPSAMSSIIQEPESALSVEGTLEFTTRKLTYGLVDNRDPIVTFEGLLEWYCFTFESSIEFETTAWGRKHGGYGNRKGSFQEICFGPGFTYTFSPDDFSLLPTEIDFFANYIYELHAPIRKYSHPDNPDMQFVNIGITMPELWLTPWFTTEVDIGNECGAVYLSSGIEHTFSLIKADKERENDHLELTLCHGIGFGSAKRNMYDADFDSFAIKDAHLSATLEWHITDHLMVAPYIAVYEQLHRRLRHEARNYIEGQTHASTQVLGGFIVQGGF